MLPPRHRREKRNFASSLDRRLRVHMRLVDGRADDFRVAEGMRVFLAAPGEPGHQLADRRHARRNVDYFFRLADALAHPGEVSDLHAHRVLTPDHERKNRLQSIMYL